jgi:Na+/H+ antiporter NhaD/arsenite permease-like protein
MNFMDFFLYKGRPSIFFAVQLGALTSFAVLYFIFRKHKEKMRLVPVEKARSWVPAIILVTLIFALAISSFFDVNFSYMAGGICVLFGAFSIIWAKFINKKPLREGIKSLDWDTTFFLMGVFIIVGSITLTGWIDVISSFLSNLIGSNIFLGYIIIVFLSVFLSAFIDNVPLLAAMLPVAISMSNTLRINPSLFLFGLLIGASLGGNITPIGASANIVSMGILKKEGYDVRFGDFVRIGLPFTLVAVTFASLFVWLVWRP